MPEPGFQPRPRSRPKATEVVDVQPVPGGANGHGPIEEPMRRYLAAVEEVETARRLVATDPALTHSLPTDAFSEKLRQIEISCTVTPLGLGYAVLAAEGVDMTLTRLRESRGDLTAEVDVARYGNHLLRQRMNLSSGQARVTTARLLDAHPGGKGAPWRDLLEKTCVEVLTLNRAGAPVQTVGDHEPDPEPPRVIDPYLPLGPTLLWGPQGSGKSTLAVAVIVTLEQTAEVMPGWMPRVDARCLVLDWESSADEWNDRLRRVAAGAGVEPPLVKYMRMRTALADQVEELAAVVDREGIGFICVDSFEKAAGAKAEGSTYEEKAERVFLALDRLARPSLLLDHVSGEDLRSGGQRVVVKSIGSTLKGAWARATYDLKRDPERSTDERVELLLHNVKINDGRPLLPYEFAIVYDGERGPIRFDRSAATSPELLKSLPLHEQLRRALLTGGARSIKDLAVELDTTQAKLRTTLSRDHGKRFIRLPNNEIGLALG